jgi:uncharacterized protein (DUF885 family)
MRSLFLGALAALGVLMSAVGSEAAKPSPLDGLCEEYWQAYLRSHPTSATSIGDHRYDDRLEDLSPAARDAWTKQLEGFLARANAMQEGALSPADRLNRAALVQEIEGQLALLRCHFDEWVVDAINGPQTAFDNLPDITTIATPDDARRYVARCAAMPRALEQHIANLKRGLAAHRVATVGAVKRVVYSLDDQLAKPPATWPMTRPLESLPASWSAAEREKFRRDLVAVVEGKVAPAYRSYRDFLAASVLPVARPPEKAGIVNLPGGLDEYRRVIRVYTSLDRDPADIHRVGLEEIARIRRELSALGAKVLGTSDVPEIQRRLRGDSAMHFRTSEEVEDKARATLARAQAAIPKWFGILPAARCEVQVMGLHEAPNSFLGYYREGAADGSRPAAYVINTYRPETRTRYEAEALAFHESIPGHHLQIAIAQELKGLPAFRRHQGVTSFVEGWALYSERLADEMGLYSGDLDRIGMLSFDAWRASRLVVDTGLHSMGWSRQQAVDYMRDNTVLAQNNIENEVDRYINWPGQALAYKLGQLEILRLRAEAEQRLGARFDLPRFHDVVLRDGAVALPVLAQQVRAWEDSLAARP